MGRLSALVLFALVVAVTVLALQAPAAWFVHRLAAALGGSVRILDAEGTVWNGRGILASPDGRWKVPVGWHLRAAPLLRGEVEVELEPQQGRDTPRGVLRLSRSGVAARGLVVDLPASALSSAFAGEAPVAFGGSIRIDARDVDIEGNAGRGTVAAHWERARLGAADGTSVALGVVRATFTPRDGVLAGTIGNEGGEVAVDGTMTLSAGGITLDASLVPRGGAGDSTARVLGQLGPVDGHGAVRLRWISERR
ncbi:MAG: type II secretion system protein N [Burkholderiales bacterium]|nr:type II secretion system protein N [Burkholderiales bacterium]MCE7876220.1 hypothetical protein [Betaproteobacteria bacterium PRO3]